MTLPQPPPVYIAVCIPHGRDDGGKVLHTEAYERAVLVPRNHQGRPVICHKFSVIGDEYARGRNAIVEQVLAQEAAAGIRYSHLFWIDDDVILPVDALDKLLAVDAPLVSGLYFMRRAPHLPVAYEEVQDPAYRDKFWPVSSYPDQGVREIAAAGMGCVLVKREVFDAVPRPWFAWRPITRLPDSDVVSLDAHDAAGDSRRALEDHTPDERTIGEDLWFFTQARRQGYQALLHGGVKCGHIGAFVFDEAQYRNMRSGYHRIPLPGKMDVLIVPAPSPAPWDGNAMDSIPLGGSEAAVGYTARALAKRGHVVTVAAGGSFNDIDGVHYVPSQYALQMLQMPRTAVIISRWQEALMATAGNQQIKAVVFWAHDITNRVAVQNVYNLAHAAVCVSPWHASVTFDHSIPGWDTDTVETFIPNGVDFALWSSPVKPRQVGKMVWLSNPNRGLMHSVRIFRRLRQRWPELELHVYGRSSVYGWDNRSDPMHEGPYLPDADEPGVFLHDPLSRPKLAEALADSWAMLYVGTWPETFGMAALEAQAAGVPVICPPFAALAETVKGGVYAWTAEDCEAAIERLMDPAEWERQSLRGREWARQMDWDLLAGDWERLLQQEVAKWKPEG